MRITKSTTGNATNPAVPLTAEQAASTGTDEQALVEQIMADFHLFIRELRCLGTQRLVKAGVSMTNLHVMGMLSHHGDMPMSRLAEILDVSLSNATGIIDRMEERGFIERVRVPDDRRVVLVRLTTLGSSTLEQAEIVRHELIDKVLRRLDAVKLRRLAASLSDIHEAVAGLEASDGPGLFAGEHTHWRAPESTQPAAH